MSPDRIKRVPISRNESGNDVARGLSSFISEGSLGGTPFKSDLEMPALWEFPQEEAARPGAATGDDVNIRTSPRYVYAASLLAAVIIVSLAGAWWGRLIPGTRPVATAASVQPRVSAPNSPPSLDVSSRPSAELSASKELRPSARPPLSRVVAAGPRERTGRTAKPAPPPPRIETRPSSRPMPAAPMVAPTPPARLPATEAQPALEGPPLALPSPPPTPAAVLRPAPEAAPAVVAARTEQGEIQRALGRYQSAYQLLDAEAARAVWPSVDVRALARAFDSLTSQELAFDTCQFDIVGEAATAQCRGSATYTPKVGSRAPKLEPRQWTFQLRKIDEGWKIQTAQTRR